jgi:hypothetical protein
MLTVRSLQVGPIKDAFVVQRSSPTDRRLSSSLDDSLMGLDVPELSKLHAGMDLTTSEGRARPVRDADWRLSSTVVESGDLDWSWNLFGSECLSRRLINKVREGRPLFSKHNAKAATSNSFRSRQRSLRGDRDQG